MASRFQSVQTNPEKYSVPSCRSLNLTLDQIADEVDRRYGIDGRAELMQRGMPIDKAIGFMGKPIEQSDTQVTWYGRQGD